MNIIKVSRVVIASMTPFVVDYKSAVYCILVFQLV
jgi:hypothetical protein